MQGGVLERIAEAKQTCNTNHPKNHLQGDHTKISWKVGLEGNNRATFGSFNFFCPINVCCAITCQSLQKAFYWKKGPVTNFNSGLSGGRALNLAYGVIVSLVYVYSLKLSLVSLFASLLLLRFCIIEFCKLWQVIAQHTLIGQKKFKGTKCSPITPLQTSIPWIFCVVTL